MCQSCRKNLNTALYANSLIGVGIASSLYHTSRGHIRKYMRWADYTMIATTTLCLSRALQNEHPKLLMAASTLLLPFQPLVVSAVHTGIMEASTSKLRRFNSHSRCTHLLPFQSNSQTTVTLCAVPQVSFAKRASTEPELRMAHNLHKMSSLLGGALFIADDAFPETPYLHAAWHLAAALGVGTCNKLLE
uniref:Uncharacterized protein n=1 Tax=Leersia perrieri TaxID=77586 RepID=A0A0D9X856_9ORYZ